ncbi:MAG: hypothetical protein QXT28_11795 [Thermofilaceae archaeon]
MGEKRDIPVRDFLEEHRKLKEAHTAPPASPTTPQPPPAAPQQPALPAVPQPAAPQPPPRVTPQDAVQHITFAQLVEGLRELGYDVKPLESLKAYAQMLDSEEQKLVREVEERQRRLEVIRAARRILKTLGV